MPLALAVRPEVGGSSVAPAGMLFAASFFGVELHWISTVLAPETRLHFAAFVGAVCILALIGGGAANAAWRLAHRGVHPALAFATAFTGMEWLRGHLGSLALPWLGVGVSTTSTPVLPLAAWVGERGLTLLFALIAGLLSHAVARQTSGERGRGVVPAALALTIWGVVHVLGSTLGVPGTGPPVRLAVVTTEFGTVGQVDVEDRLLWIEGVLRATPPGEAGAVVLPEATLPLPLERRPDYVRRLSALSEHLRAPLILGAFGVTGETVFNSTFVVGADGILARSDKQHRVGIVESGFGAGEPEVLRAGAFAFGAMICFESLFSDVARTLTRDGAAVLLNPTSESWFALASEAVPLQHRNHLRVRAAESRRWIVRAANDGESLVVDPRGALRWGSARPGVEVVTVREAQARTPFVTLGDVWGWVAGLLMIGALLTALLPGGRHVGAKPGPAIPRRAVEPP